MSSHLEIRSLIQTSNHLHFDLKEEKTKNVNQLIIPPPPPPPPPLPTNVYPIRPQKFWPIAVGRLQPYNFRFLFLVTSSSYRKMIHP